MIPAKLFFSQHLVTCLRHNATDLAAAVGALVGPAATALAVTAVVAVEGREEEVEGAVAEVVTGVVEGREEGEGGKIGGTDTDITLIGTKRHKEGGGGG